MRYVFKKCVYTNLKNTYLVSRLQYKLVSSKAGFCVYKECIKCIPKKTNITFSNITCQRQNIEL